MFLNLDSLQMRYEPFPIGLAQPILDRQTYDEMVASFPPQDLFLHMPKLGDKFTLSEKFNSKNYHAYVRSNPAWREFHRYVKSDAFIPGVLGALRAHHVDLGIEPAPAGISGRLISLFSRRAVPLSTRFEFSMLPAMGGNIRPHTDNANKIVTLVISMVGPGEWDSKLGGGTEVLRPKDVRHAYNQINESADFSEFDTICTYEFLPNQAVVFVKTFNSWHAVRPMTGSDPARMRRTLTINIEAPK